MGYAKLSVTIPREIYEEIKQFSENHDTKLSHVVTQALSAKLKQIKEAELIENINRIYDEPGVAEEQRNMSESIAENTDLQELPW